MIQLQEIKEAYEILAPVVKRTPLEHSKTFSHLTKTNVFLKEENLQTTGSFKIRGAYNKIAHLSDEERRHGVVCASAGNHAQGVALASTLMGVKSVVFMPVYTPPSKIIATKSYGATVVLEGVTYDDAAEAAKKYGAKKKMTFVHAFNDPYVIAGQGTIGIEIYDALPTVDAVLVPIGGGGLIGGIAVALKTLKPKVKIIGVEAEGAQSMKLSLEKHTIVPLQSINTIADGIAVKTPKELTFEIAERYVDRVVAVNDEDIAYALYLLLQRAKLIVEPSGAIALAALLSQQVMMPKKNVVVVLSGGNVNLSLLTQIIERGMMRTKQLMKIAVTALDKPKALKDILEILASFGANVQSIAHDRCTTAVPVGYVRIVITFQTLGREQIELIKQEFNRNHVQFHTLS
jgi:threonine dehydratase